MKKLYTLNIGVILIVLLASLFAINYFTNTNIITEELYESSLSEKITQYTDVKDPVLWLKSKGYLK
jgi:type II secretory pathway component PulC